MCIEGHGVLIGTPHVRVGEPALLEGRLRHQLFERPDEIVVRHVIAELRGKPIGIDGAEDSAAVRAGLEKGQRQSLTCRRVHQDPALRQDALKATRLGKAIDKARSLQVHRVAVLLAQRGVIGGVLRTPNGDKAILREPVR